MAYGRYSREMIEKVLLTMFSDFIKKGYITRHDVYIASKYGHDIRGAGLLLLGKIVRNMREKGVPPTDIARIRLKVMEELEKLQRKMSYPVFRPPLIVPEKRIEPTTAELTPLPPKRREIVVEKRLVRPTYKPPFKPTRATVYKREKEEEKLKGVVAVPSTYLRYLRLQERVLKGMSEPVVARFSISDDFDRYLNVLKDMMPEGCKVVFTSKTSNNLFGIVDIQCDTGEKVSRIIGELREDITKHRMELYPHIMYKASMSAKRYAEEKEKMREKYLS